MTNEELKQRVEDLIKEAEQLKKQIKENEESNKEKDLNFFEWYDNDIHRTHLFDHANSETTNEIYDYSCFNSPKERAKEYKHFLARRVLQYEADKLNNGWKPNWKDDNEIKYRIYYCYETNKYEYDCDYTSCCLDIYLKSEESSEDLIKKCESYTEKKYPILDWYFGIKR